MKASGFFEKTRVFLEMIKFEHSLFALPFAYLGLFLGARHAGLAWPRAGMFWGVTAAMVGFRTFGMSLNRLLDRHIDALNPRTATRALPAGLLTPGFVWALAGLSLAIFEAAAWSLGPLCFKLAAFPLALAVLYPFTKRFTWLCHVVLGIILGISPYGAWLGAGAGFSWIPGLLTLGVAAWVAGFDIIYALLDYDFDRTKGLYSVPAVFGERAALRLTRLLHAGTWAAWLWAGNLAGLGMIYAAGMLLVGFFLVREHWLIRSFGLKKLNEAFFTMNAVVSVSVFVAALFDLAGGLS